MKRVGILKDKAFLNHFAQYSHPENPERLHAINHMIEKEQLLKKVTIVPPRLASLDEIGLIHTPQYIKKIEDTKNRDFSSLDGDTYASKDTFNVALLAAGSLIECLEKILRGEIDSGFGFVRPPGHHAEPDRAMGFCIFNNIAIAAAYAYKKRKIKRIAIVDFDLHHGNGTQRAFWDTDEVLFISTHQFPHYPGTGSMNEIGTGRGKGYTINIPLPVGFGDPEYTVIFKEIITPVLLEFNPSLILASAGFDSFKNDPLGGMELTGDGFENIAILLRQAAEKTCNGKIACTLEGGYSPIGLQEGTYRIIKVLLEDAPEKLQLKQKQPSRQSLAVIDKIKSHVGGYWSL